MSLAHETIVVAGSGSGSGSGIGAGVAQPARLRHARPIGIDRRVVSGIDLPVDGGLASTCLRA